MSNGNETNSMPKVKRVLRWFEKKGDKYIGEEELAGIELTQLQILFGESLFNPMYECYPVTESHVQCLEQFIKEKIRLDLYSYFVECDAVE